MAVRKVEAMIPIYGSLIIKQKMSILEVPGTIREEVEKWLMENEDEFVEKLGGNV